MAKSETLAASHVQERNCRRPDGLSYYLCYIRKEHLAFLPEGAIRIWLMLIYRQLRNGLKPECAATSSAVEAMLEKKHGLFDDINVICCMSRSR